MMLEAPHLLQLPHDVRWEFQLVRQLAAAAKQHLRARKGRVCNSRTQLHMCCCKRQLLPAGASRGRLAGMRV